jgi:phage gpG-like protein
MALIEFQWMPEPVVIADEYELMAVRFEDRRIVMEEALQVVLKNTEEHFAAEGPGWAAWAESTAIDPRVGASILTRSGALRDAATSEGSYEVNSDFILWTGASAPAYWRFHWTGTSRMPQRNFIGLDSAGEDEVVAVFDAWMQTL